MDTSEALVMMGSGVRVPPSALETMTAVNPAAPTINGDSLWPRLAGLPLVVEACEYDRLHAVLANEFERVTTHVRLAGAGADGLGEDVSVFREDGTALHETRPSLPLAGEWTLAGFCEHLATLELWPEPPEYDMALRLRNWAFESAALDLALRQAGRPLHDVLGLEPRAVRFVNSLGLGEEPSIEPVRRRLARSPGVRFKLDAQATWAPALVDEVAATGAVDTIDFKGQYGLEVEDPQALGALYDRVLAAFPDAYLEDPHDLPEIARRLGDHLERVSYDAPIRRAEDIGATPLAGRVVNVKPSRIGGLRALLEVYARCAREGRPMYGGGMGELGVGRGQIELLAALFHADAPNDVAPSAYNEDDPAGGLPASPLGPRPDATGFRWAA
jgi:L-alanine-DL-glutamate epimerase-like enolase superfamily enzyme